MQRPETEKDPRECTSPIDQRLLCFYLVRGIARAISEDRIGEHRYRNRAAELTGALKPLIASQRTASSFAQELASRFGVDLAGSDESFPVELWTPDWRMRWDRAVSVLGYNALRAAIDENPAFVAQFALAHHADDEAARLDHELLLSYVPPVTRERYVPVLPGQDAMLTRCHWATWTLSSALAHGADGKSGNVTPFRMQEEFDLLTGELVQVLFLSGNAVRGNWRDLMFGRWLQLLGLQASDLPPAKAHALLAGGSVEAGADTAAADPVIRKKAREMCPPWDLFAGCIESQIMQGRARVRDAILVCRETAAKVAPFIAPGMDPHELAAKLPEVAECIAVRQGTRNAHKDIPEAHGSQMLYGTQHLKPGLQMLHSVQLWGLDGVSEITASCFADLLEYFSELSTIGAKASSGFGCIAFDPYRPTQGTAELPSRSIYLDYVAANREAMREWALRPAQKALAVKPKRGGRREANLFEES